MLALWTGSLPIASAAIPECERPPRSLPPPASCRVQLPAGTAGRDAGTAVGALVDAALADIAGARHADAERRLDCAASLLPADGEPALRHRLQRARGSLAYARGDLSLALSELECALAMARGGLERAVVANDMNAVGSARRRLGDYRGALEMLAESLRLQRDQGARASAVLNNIADVYRDLGDPDEAMRHYRQALSGFLAEDGTHGVHAAHVLESMAVVELERGDTVRAREWLGRALERYRDGGRHDYALRVYGWLMRVELARGELAEARRWRAAGEAVAAEHGLTPPAPFDLSAARTERLSGAPDAAVLRLRAALARLSGSDAERAGLYEELAAAQEALGDRAGAIESLRRAQREERAYARAGRDRELAWLRARFETAERDRIIALREATLRKRTFWLWLTLALSVSALFAIWLVFRRRRRREREAEAARLAQKEAELAHYRREADALAEDRQLLQALLDSRGDAMCLLDAEGTVLAANRAAADILGPGARAAIGSAIVDALHESQRGPLQAALERMEDAPGLSLALMAADGRRLHAQLGQWRQGDGLIVLGLSVLDDDAPAGPLPPAPAGDVPAGDAHASAPMAGLDPREDFRRALVELMLSALEHWECDTGTGRLELAERSRIWRVAVDDGRVRARSMERYLSLARLPQNPRWRDVVRTAYFVLQQCTMPPEARERLQRQVDAVLAYTRRSALV